MKIGEFAKLSSATIRTLRYYDDIGLLKPDSIDQFTGYRIYSSKKLEQMRQIQAMKEIGFTLLEIKNFLAIDEADENGKIDFIAAKRQEIELERQKTETRLSALDDLIIQLKEGEDKMVKKNYCLPYCDMCDDNELTEHRKINKETIGKAYSEIKIVPKFVKIAAEGSCFGAVDENGKVYIWGNNWAGQCDIPEDLPPIAEFGIGYSHVVALDVNGKLHGWGKSEYGALNFSEDLPIMVSVKVKNYKTVALSATGKIFSWGEANHGSQPYMPRNTGTITQIAASAYRNAALNSEGEFFSWGMFIGSLAVDAKIETISLTNYDMACLGADGKIYGDVKRRELNKRFKPKPEMPNIKKLVAGRENLAAIDEDGKLYIWGEYAKITDGNSIMDIPLNLPPVIDAAFGYYDIICLGKDGKFYGWGIADVIVPPAFDGFQNGPVFVPAPVIDINVPRDVYTFEELCEAVQERVQNITIKADMTIPGGNSYQGKTNMVIIPSSFYVINGITLTVSEGVTLTVECQNFFIQKKLINNGIINGHGCVGVNDSIEGTGTIIKGSLFSETPMARISPDGIIVVIFGINADEISEYLAENSIYTEASNIYAENKIVTINDDLVIPKGKILRINNGYTLAVSEGATLTIEGTVETWNDPIINGTVVREIFNINKKAYQRDVYTFDDLREAEPQTQPTNQSICPGIITIKNSIVITGDHFHIIPPLSERCSFIIDEGVTLTVDSQDFTVYKDITNNGVIDGSGHIYLDAPIRGTGSVNTANGLKIDIYDPDIDEIGQYLSENSFYTDVIYTNMEPLLPKSVFLPTRDNSKQNFITINNDLVIAKGKSLWLHDNSILKVSEGATLIVEGKIKTFNEPVINGAVIGEITIIDSGKPHDVYTYTEFYEAVRDRVNEINIKDNIVVSGRYWREPIHCDTLIIDKNVTFTVNYPLCIQKKLINNGMIDGTGRINVLSPIEGAGGVNAANDIAIQINNINIHEVDTYLTESSVYTTALCIEKEEAVIAIDNDLVIPKGKKLWMNYHCTLKVSKGATLIVEGTVETYNEPITEGVIAGKVDVLDKNPYPFRKNPTR